MQSIFIRKIVKTISTVGAQSNLSLKQLGDFKIPLPPLPEQKKIAEILSTVDEQIEQTEQLIEKTKELKKGLMQKLLTKGIGHARFKKTEVGEIPEEWEVKRVEEICELGRGRVISRKEIEQNPGKYPVFSSQTQNKGCMGYISTYDFEGDYVTWTTDGVNAGTTFYRSGKFNCTNVCGTLKSKINNLDMRFLSLILGKFTKKYVAKNGNSKLMNNVMATIKIPIPTNKEEQKYIADVIYQFDNFLEIYESQKQQLQQLKKGLMQKLLTGKIRVKV